MIYLLVVLNSFIISDNPLTWKYDFQEAKTEAQAQNKNILMVFSGSDWCAPCKKLKKNILLSDDWIAFEKENVVVLYLDFPSKRKNKLSKDQMKHNEALAEEYNGSGSFPKVILMSSEGKKIKEVKHADQSVEEFILQLK